MNAFALRPAWGACLLLWLIQSACLAGEMEEEELALVYGDKSTISLATGSKQSLRRAPAVASVVTAEDIAAMGATELEQVLETIPGLHVSRGPGSYFPIYMLRGIGGGGPTNPQILVMQNGVPLSTMYNGDRGLSWRALPVENIARIEVIRGPGSALYGADAFAGVINIVTRGTGDAAGTVVAAGVGGYDTWDVWLRHNTKWQQLGIAAYLRLGETGGVDERVEFDAQSLNDSRFGTRVSRAPGPLNTGYEAVDAHLELSFGKWRWRNHFKLRDDLETGAGINSALDPESSTQAQTFLSDLSWVSNTLLNGWEIGASASYLHFKEEASRLILFPAGVRLGPNLFPEGLIGGPRRWEQNRRLSAYALYTDMAGLTVRLGLGHDDLHLYRAQTFKNFRLPAVGAPIPTGPQMDYGSIQPHILPQRRKVDYLYGQAEWRFLRDWGLTLGARHDRYADFGKTNNPRLALVWDASLHITAKLLYGRAFRAPSFNEQYGINPVANGNPQLKPERIETLEAALTWQVHPDLQMNVSLFTYAMRDLIRVLPNPAPAPGATFANIPGEQEGRGGEIELNWRINTDWRLTANYARQRATDPVTRQDAGYAPHQQLYAQLDWRTPQGWTLSGQANHVADRRRVPSDVRRTAIDDYLTVNLSLSSEKSQRGWQFTASITNLFDEDVREPSVAPGQTLPNDIPLAGRGWYLNAGYRF